MGDCVDCNLCVQVCPVGIDIRDGLQYECISCGLCIDACDMTMDKFNYEKGLIAFKKAEEKAVSWKKHIAYGACVSLSFLAMLAWALNWQNFNVNIIRELFRLNDIDNVTFDSDWNSKTINDQANDMLKSQQRYSKLGALTGVPTFIVNGKYKITMLYFILKN